ncbi:MAG: acyltransferase family protein, partial [Bacillota bacterium]|nr:acyltransferase family protein [Bacillota bacterium]
AINQLKNLPSKPAATHLWFMYALITIYILSPLLKKLMDSMTENLARYMFAVWAVFGALLPTAAFFARPGYRALLSLDPSYNLNIMNGYLGYFLFGYLFFKSDIRFSKRSLLCILTADTLFIALGTWLATTRIGQYTEMYKGYTRAFVFVLSIAAFLLAKEAFTGRRLSKKAGPAVKFLSAVSFGVYLVHNLLVNFISQKINLYPAGSVHVLFCCYFAALFVSIVFIVLLASIKPVCFLFTGLTYDFAGKSCNIPFLVKKIRGG